MYEQKLTLGEAFYLWSRGKRGTMALYRNDTDNAVYCQGLGCNERVLAMWIKVNGKVYDINTYNQLLIIRKEREGKPGWAVFAENEQQFTTSEMPGFDLEGIILVKPTRYQKEAALPGNEKSPVSIKIKYRNDLDAVLLVQDKDAAKLFLAEGQDMALASAPDKIQTIASDEEINTEAQVEEVHYHVR